MKTDCRFCNEFIAWLRERAATDKDAARLLARFEDEEQFCEAHAHIDRRLFRDFLSAQWEDA